MARLFTLPVSAAGEPPTLDATRKKLGGRAQSEAGAGELVALDGPRGEVAGVVLFVRAGELDVWIGGGVVRRVKRASARAVDVASVAPELVAIAADARAFAALREGDDVAFASDHASGEGTLVEKCRFGGIVQRADGSLVGAGFRRIWSAIKRSRSSS